MSKKKALLLLILAPVVGMASALILAWYQLAVWQYHGPEVAFEIKEGDGFASINGRLHKKRLISSAQLFHRYCKLKGYTTRFQTGSYHFKSGITMLDIVQTLLKGGRASAIRATLPEGKNLFEMAGLLENKGVIQSRQEFIRLAKDESFARSLGVPADRLEGYLYPDTYHFAPNSPPTQILKKMVALYHKKTAALDFSRAPLGLNKRQVLILASIVEKETGAGHERPIIAGVFINRLKKGIRLQSDPTTIYGIFENFNGNLRRKHLRQKTAYNTYRIAGLPKGPISNPGLASLQAVLNPAEHDFFYFVSQNDGTHVFSKTYREHRQAVARYQKDWRARKGKSWRDLSRKKK